MTERESDFELEHVKAQLKVAIAALEAIKKHKEQLAGGRDPHGSTTWKIADKALTDIRDSIYE